jgi:hypothetical protein
MVIVISVSAFLMFASFSGTDHLRTGRLGDKAIFRGDILSMSFEKTRKGKE